MLDENGYYSLREILGYNAKYSIVLSDRGRGKSFGTKHFLMAQDGEFMCVYRQIPDLRKAIGSWIDPLCQERKTGNLTVYERDDFEWQGNERDGMQLLYKGQVKGFFRCLTEVNSVKQESFPDTLNWVWMDEFIPLAWKKLQGIESEGDALRTIVKTIEHDTVHTRTEKGLKEVRVLMYANPFNWNNPMLSYFHINGLKGVGIHRAGPGVVWELLPPYEEKKRSKKMTVDEFLGEEVNKNMGFLNQGAFVKAIPKGSIPYMSLRIRRRYYLLMKNGMEIYVKHTQMHTDVYSQFGGRVLVRYGTLEGLQEDETCIDSSGWKDRLKNLCFRGLIYYDDINVKFDFLNDLSSLR